MPNADCGNAKNRSACLLLALSASLRQCSYEYARTSKESAVTMHHISSVLRLPPPSAIAVLMTSVSVRALACRRCIVLADDA